MKWSSQAVGVSFCALSDSLAVFMVQAQLRRILIIRKILEEIGRKRRNELGIKETNEEEWFDYGKLKLWEGRQAVG